MMLKINKTLPRNKVRRYDNSGNDDISHRCTIRYITLATLICGIMPGLMGLSSYIVPTQKVSAVEQTNDDKKTIDNIKYMQELSKEVCEATSIGISTTLIDLRDDSDYTVAKLSDGKCWMTQNLRIINTTIDFTDSNIEDGSFTIPDSALWTDISNTTPHAYYDNDEDYGAYYNWYAATAGTGTESMTSGNASGSICPKGWRLPTGGSGGELQALYNNGVSSWITNGDKNGYWIGAANAMGGAFFLAAGYVNTDDGSLYGTGSGGRYWSSTTGNSNDAYYLGLNSSDIVPADPNNRRRGDSIRCISADIPEAELPKDNIPSYSPIVKDRGNADVIAVKVAPVISIDAAEGDSIEVDPNLVSTGTITATVSANTEYVVQLSASQTSLVSSDSSNSFYIPTSSNVVKGTNAWGIRTDSNTYLPITTTPTSFYNTTVYDEDKQSTTHTFHLGVSIVNTLPSGEYSTTVTITAVNN